MHKAERAGGEDAAGRIDEPAAASGIARSELVTGLQPVELYEEAVAGAGVEVNAAGGFIAVKQVADGLNLRTEDRHAVQFERERRDSLLLPGCRASRCRSASAARG